VSDIV